ncbi:hypothetical protein [Streptomyces sp. UG1]|uniref:hypothetical protein n=1 Tax=Streptomyces sp. UG1 TaxID=3417652 RepID=UPI003CF59941
MHPAARVFQILFLLGGLGMFAYALDEAGDGRRSNAAFRYECTTSNIGTAQIPRQKEDCVSREAWTYQHKTDDVLVSALAGIGLMIGAAAVSVGGARRTTAPRPAPAPVAQPYGAPVPFPPHPGHPPVPGR